MGLFGLIGRVGLNGRLGLSIYFSSKMLFRSMIGIGFYEISNFLILSNKLSYSILAFFKREI